MANYFCTDSVEEQVDYLTDQVKDLKTNKLDKAAVVQATGIGTDVVMSQKAVTDTINENLQTVNTELDGKLTKPANPSAESVVTMLNDGSVATHPLSELRKKLYKHTVRLNASTIASRLIFYVYNRSYTKLTFNDIAGSYFLASITDSPYSGVVSCIIQPSTEELSTHKLITKGVVINANAPFALDGVTESYDMSINDTVTEV